MVKWLNPLLALALLLLFWLSLATGSADVPVISGLLDWLGGETSSAALVIGEIRLPRGLLAVAVGASMGLAGAGLQGLLRNPLVDPSLVGASQGAALGAAGVFYFNGFAALGVFAVPMAGLIGAALTLFILVGLSGPVARPAIIIMAGLAIGALSSALLAVVLNFAPNPFAMQELVFWLLGSVSNRGLEHLTVVLPALLVGALVLAAYRPLLLGLSLGDQIAESMGLDVVGGGRRIVLGSALLVGASVAVAGNIGFIGLLAPHLMRPLVHYRPDRLLLPAALCGAIVVCAADILVRLLPPERELKLGVLTALIGAPFFIYLVYKERQRWI